MEDTQKIEIINHLKELECCDRCILHHLIVLEPEDYVNPSLYLHKLGFTVLEETNEDNKKLKQNICRLCLDVLRDSTLDDFVQAIEHSNIKDYKTDDFYINVSLPKSIFIRKHAFCIYLKEKYSEAYKESMQCEVMSKIMKYSINNKIAKQLNKKQSKRSNFEINLNIGYPDDENEVKNVSCLDKNKFKGKHNGNKKDFISRNNIYEILNVVKDDLFKEHFPTLPSIPTHKVNLIEVTCLSAPIYLGGRYLKFSRTLCQTPWIIGGKKVVELSVQDILFDAIEKYIGKQEKMIFSSSGREDVDVRMLGHGRPFYIQIENPKNRHISKEQCRKIEEEISQSKQLGVIQLQTVYKSDLNKIKEGEQNKKKTYNALCTTTAPDIDKVVNLINEQEVVEIAQKTPIRVLHRRNHAIRKRCIYKMKAKAVPGYNHLFELECVTQAGTYVKEFVHGDFERTIPNIGNIVGYPCDIIALDVTNIDLDWPQPIPISEEKNASNTEEMIKSC